MKKTLIISLASILLLLTGCQEVTPTTENADTQDSDSQVVDTPTEEISKGGQLYTNEKFGYKIIVPDGVTIDEHQESGYVEIYRDEPSEKWSFGVIENEEGLTLQKYVTQKYDNDDCLISQENIRISGNEAIRILDKCNMGGELYKDIFLSEGNFYEIAQVIGNDKARFDEITASFELTD